MSDQLPLGIALRDSATFDNFLPGPNGAALHQLRVGGEPFVYLWGPAGSGRSHLLQASCHAAVEAKETGFYLSFTEPGVIPDLLEGLENLSLVALDDISAVLGDAEWELALFAFYNRARACGCRVVVAADGPAGALPIALADLRSRLQWGPVFQLRPLDDDGKAQALRLRASRRGLEMSDEVARYLLRRFPRDPSTLFDTLERLDEASMIAKRRLTIPFVREQLAD